MPAASLVEQAGKTMGEVVGAVRRVTDIIDEISAATHEQSEGIGQVSTAVAQMDQATQQNASLVEDKPPPQHKRCSSRPSS